MVGLPKLPVEAGVKAPVTGDPKVPAAGAYELNAPVVGLPNVPARTEYELNAPVVGEPKVPTAGA